MSKTHCDIKFSDIVIIKIARKTYPSFQNADWSCKFKSWCPTVTSAEQCNTFHCRTQGVLHKKL